MNADKSYDSSHMHYIGFLIVDASFFSAAKFLLGANERMRAIQIIVLLHFFTSLNQMKAATAAAATTIVYVRLYDVYIF